MPPSKEGFLYSSQMSKSFLSFPPFLCQGRTARSECGVFREEGVRRAAGGAPEVPVDSMESMGQLAVDWCIQVDGQAGGQRNKWKAKTDTQTDTHKDRQTDTRADSLSEADDDTEGQRDSRLRPPPP